MSLSNNNFIKEIFTLENEKEKLKFEAEVIQLNFIHQIQKLMEKTGMNKAQLAKKLGITKSYITLLFSADKPLNLHTLAKLQKIFNIRFVLDYQKIKNTKLHKLSSKKLKNFIKQNYIHLKVA